MKRIIYAVTLMFAGAAPIKAEDIRGFDPNQSCVEILSNTGGTTDQFMIAAWVFGYLAAQNGTLRPVTIDNNKVILENITKACIKAGSTSLVGMVKKSRPGADQGKGSEAHVRGFLEEFVKPGNDLRGLTKQVLPRAEQIHKVYDEPLASNLIAMYDAALTPDVQIAGKDGQTEVLVVYTTTGALKAGAKALDQFPGGYKKVLKYFKADVPIVRFKFVRPGETSGMAYDGLIYVDGAWTWMPKPWRALKD